MIIPRDYQTEAVASIYRYFQEHPEPEQNPIIAMPTGTGKAVVIALFLESIYRSWGNQKVMILTHVMELVQQNYEKLMTLWAFAPSGIYSAGLKKKDIHSLITFAGIASVYKKASLFGHIDIILIDECHLISPADQTMYRAFISALRLINPYVRVIGLTATPYRQGQGLITEPFAKKNGNLIDPLFTDICFDITDMKSFNRLIAEMYLSPVVPKRTETYLDTDGLHTLGGDFIASEMQTKFNKEEISRRAIEEAADTSGDRKRWLTFCAGVEHAIDVAEMMNSMGIKAIAIHSKMDPDDRRKGIAAYKAGYYQAATNNNILTTGFDCPAIDLIMMLRATQSTGLWVQMLGRGTRPLFAGDHDLTTLDGRTAAVMEGGKQNCLVLDYAKNTKRLGPINDPVIPKARGNKGGTAPVKECPVCGTFVHATLRYCDGILKDGTSCNHEFSFENKLVTTAGTEELIKGDLPVVEVFKVDTITYNLHEKHDMPPAVRVSYFCGFKVFDEYICIEHQNYAGKKARDWWRVRGHEPLPYTTEEALDRVDELKAPTHLRVWTNKKYPEIMSVCYDGTAWGTVDKVKDPVVRVGNKKVSGERSVDTQVYDEDDEIPF